LFLQQNSFKKVDEIMSFRWKLQRLEFFYPPQGLVRWGSKQYDSIDNELFSFSEKDASDGV